MEAIFLVPEHDPVLGKKTTIALTRLISSRVGCFKVKRRAKTATLIKVLMILSMLPQRISLN